MNSGHSHVYDITGEPSGKTHHHRHHHSSENHQHPQQRPHERQNSHHQSSSPAPLDRNDPKRQDSKKRRFQYNESFMAPHRSSHHQSDSEPTNPSPQRTPVYRKTRKSYISPTRRTIQRNIPTFDHNSQHRINPHQNRNLFGNGNHFQPSATSLYNRRHRIPNRRIASQWPIEQNQPVRQGSSVVLRAPSPTIVIANSRFSSERIRERQQPIRVENGNRHQQPNRATSQLSLGSNSVRPSRQGIYLRTDATGAQLPDILDSSKSGSNIAGASTGYSWRISGFTECSKSCGGGKKFFI